MDVTFSFLADLLKGAAGGTIVWLLTTAVGWLRRPNLDIDLSNGKSGMFELAYLNDGASHSVPLALAFVNKGRTPARFPYLKLVFPPSWLNEVEKGPIDSTVTRYLPSEACWVYSRQADGSACAKFRGLSRHIVYPKGRLEVGAISPGLSSKGSYSGRYKIRYVVAAENSSERSGEFEVRLIMKSK